MRATLARVTRPSTLLLAALLAGPALWRAFVQHQLDPTSAMLRYLLAVLAAAAMLAMLDALLHGSHRRRSMSHSTAVAEHVLPEPDDPPPSR